MVSNITNVISGNNEIPNFQSKNLSKNNCELSDDLISLCFEGLSFILTPNIFDWRQLQIDFDKIKNALREILFF